MNDSKKKAQLVLGGLMIGFSIFFMAGAIMAAWNKNGDVLFSMIMLSIAMSAGTIGVITDGWVE